MTKIEALTDQQALDVAREEGRRAGLEGALVVLDELQHDGGASNFYEGWDSALATADDRIRALIDKPADPVAEAARVLMNAPELMEGWSEDGWKDICALAQKEGE